MSRAFKTCKEMRRTLIVAKGYFSERFGNSKIMSNKTRLESDSMGTIEVPAEHYSGCSDSAVTHSLFDRRGSHA